MKNRKGISPVIATIIMVAIAIVISIAAAFWLTGLMGAFTTYENIRITAYASRTQYDYDIFVVVDNVGSIGVTITGFILQGTSVPQARIDKTLPYDLDYGESVTFKISGYKTTDFRPGSTIKLVVMTSRASYEGQLTLP